MIDSGSARKRRARGDLYRAVGRTGPRPGRRNLRTLEHRHRHRPRIAPVTPDLFGTVRPRFAPASTLPAGCAPATRPSCRRCSGIGPGPGLALEQQIGLHVGGRDQHRLVSDATEMEYATVWAKRRRALQHPAPATWKTARSSRCRRFGRSVSQPATSCSTQRTRQGRRPDPVLSPASASASTSSTTSAGADRRRSPRRLRADDHARPRIHRGSAAAGNRRVATAMGSP